MLGKFLPKAVCYSKKSMTFGMKYNCIRFPTGFYTSPMIACILLNIFSLLMSLSAKKTCGPGVILLC